MGYVREVRDGDIEFIAKHMRQADVMEVQATVGSVYSLLDALRQAVSYSAIACTVVGDNPAAVFGVAPVSDIEGVIWLLGTDELTSKSLKREFLKQSRDYLDRLQEFRPLLFNYVDERNTLHIRWLKWVGCTFIKRHEHYGHEQRPFLEFTRIKACA
ncbi:MAG: phage protein Gp13 family protein [Cetobacterium sp.]